ncbi:hypothetical protein GCM10022419_113700 [Nonomuraea rosea]|uniref:DUF1152 domain-containing protein n=1 Tax=Nonomuraea rosea TaxID=638574 RepID=A0ABP6ZKH7_9ACTN
MFDSPLSARLETSRRILVAGAGGGFDVYAGLPLALALRGRYAFPKVGVQPLRAAYAELAERLELDAIVLVDGGTGILMRGDEAGLGAPVGQALYLDRIEDTVLARQIAAVIEAYRDEVISRPPKAFPHLGLLVKVLWPRGGHAGPTRG